MKHPKSELFASVQLVLGYNFIFKLVVLFLVMFKTVQTLNGIQNKPTIPEILLFP